MSVILSTLDKCAHTHLINCFKTNKRVHFYTDANIDESYNQTLYVSNCLIYVGISTLTFYN